MLFGRSQFKRRVLWTTFQHIQFLLNLFNIWKCAKKADRKMYIGHDFFTLRLTPVLVQMVNPFVCGLPDDGSNPERKIRRDEMHESESCEESEPFDYHLDLWHWRVGVNFTNMFTGRFCVRRSRKHKKTDDFTVFFRLFSSAQVNAARRMLMKLTLDYLSA